MRELLTDDPKFFLIFIIYVAKISLSLFTDISEFTLSLRASVLQAQCSALPIHTGCLDTKKNYGLWRRACIESRYKQDGDFWISG